ncbi:MAG: NADH-quinone oxidoreductase subunit C [Candidatus Paceibacteria bacterium]|jgi:NADH-quinone oxidoreductase subunit C
MDFQGIFDRLKAQNVPGVIEANEPRKPDPENKKDKGRGGDPYVLVDPNLICEFMVACRDDERLGFEILADLSAADPSKESEEFWMVYQLLSIKHRQRLAVKSLIPKADAKINTLSGIYRAARWHERECAEMFGISFNGHPDPRKMLLPDDWVGHPLRKDYEFPTEYHGISCV